MKNESPEKPIALPVKLWVLDMHTCKLAAANGAIIATFSSGVSKGVPEYIAKVLNEYPSLEQRLAEAERVIDHYAQGDNWNGPDDGSQFAYCPKAYMHGYTLARYYRNKYPIKGEAA